MHCYAVLGPIELEKGESIPEPQNVSNCTATVVRGRNGAISNCIQLLYLGLRPYTELTWKLWLGSCSGERACCIFLKNFNLLLVFSLNFLPFGPQAWIDIPDV